MLKYRKLVFIVQEPSLKDLQKGTRFVHGPEQFYMGILKLLPEQIPAEFYYLNEVNSSNLNNAVVIPIGEVCTKSITGLSHIAKLRGQPIYTTASGMDSVLIPVFHPMYFEHNYEAMVQTAGDIELAYSLHKGYKDFVDETELVWVGLYNDIEDDLRDLVEGCKATGICVPDFETNAKRFFRKDFKATLLAISFQPGCSFIIPLHHKDSYLDEDQIQRCLEVIGKEIFANEAIRKVNHNIKFDMHVARVYGMEMLGPLGDTMLMHHLIDANLKHDLKSILAILYPARGGYEEELDGVGSRRSSGFWESVNLQKLGVYAGTDTDATIRAAYQFETEILNTPRQYSIYRNLILPVLRVLFEAEQTGMYIDPAYLYESKEIVKSYIEQTKKKLQGYKQVRQYRVFRRERVRAKLITMVSEKMVMSINPKHQRKYEEVLNLLRLGIHPKLDDVIVNFGSPQQVAELLYTDQGFNLPMVKDDRTGLEVSKTDAKTLKRLKGSSDFIEDLLVYRTLLKAYNTYLVGFGKLVDDYNMIHPEFGQHGTRTGRLSVKNPNSQNISTRSKIDNAFCKDAIARIKQCFKAPAPDWSIMQIDFKQMELMIAAEFAPEWNMIKVYQDKGDLHKNTAINAARLTEDKWLQLPKDKVDDLRFKAKAGNFGFVYGMGVQGFIIYARDNYGIEYTEQEAEDYREAYFHTYPGLRPWHAVSITNSRDKGYSETLYGRRRYYRDINSTIQKKRTKDERDAINQPVQGTSGETTLFAVALLCLRLPPSLVSIVNSVHDSILPYVHNSAIDYVAQICSQTCSNLPTQMYFDAKFHHVTMEVDIEVGPDNWKDLKKHKNKFGLI